MSASRLLPAHVLHHDEIVAVRRLDLVNRDDVRVIERRGGVCFLDKPAAAIVVADAIGGNTLIATSRFEPWIAGAIHLAHPAGADEGEDLVRPECRTGRERHLFGAIISGGARISRSESARVPQAGGPSLSRQYSVVKEPGLLERR